MLKILSICNIGRMPLCAIYKRRWRCNVPSSLKRSWQHLTVFCLFYGSAFCQQGDQLGSTCLSWTRNILARTITIFDSRKTACRFMGFDIFEQVKIFMNPSFKISSIHLSNCQFIMEVQIQIKFSRADIKQALDLTIPWVVYKTKMRDTISNKFLQNIRTINTCDLEGLFSRLSQSFLLSNQLDELFFLCQLDMLWQLRLQASNAQIQQAVVQFQSLERFHGADCSKWPRVLV